jgi:hypothetical protein
MLLETLRHGRTTGFVLAFLNFGKPQSQILLADIWTAYRPKEELSYYTGQINRFRPAYARRTVVLYKQLLPSPTLENIDIILAAPGMPI